MRRLSAIATCLIVVSAMIGARPTTAAFPGADGRIVFIARIASGKALVASMTSSGTDFKFLTTDGQSASTHGDGFPAWSPGGTLIVFARYTQDGNGDLWTMKADGSGQKRLTTHPLDDDYAGFSADGSRIVFSSNRSGNYEIYSMAIDGTDVRRLTNHPATDWWGKWSPSNDRIAFESNRRGFPEIYTMNPDGTDVQRETTATAATFDAEPAWSGDGTTIFFTRVNIDAVDSSIWKVAPATNATALVADGAGLQYKSAGQPSGDGIVHSTTEAGHADIRVLTGTQPGANLTLAYPFHSFSPDWQPVPEFPLVDARFSSFEGDIVWAYDNDITTGCSAERFCPDNSVTREQMASFLVRALDLPATATDYFTDDEGSSHEDNINRLRAAGITTGCTATTFCPTADVKRDQMASFISRGFNLAATGTDYFTDDEGNTHEANINKLRAAGITTGCTATTYCPSGVVTRGQMAAFLHRAVD